jgi:hypothetical protein
VADGLADVIADRRRVGVDVLDGVGGRHDRDHLVDGDEHGGHERRVVRAEGGQRPAPGAVDRQHGGIADGEDAGVRRAGVDPLVDGGQLRGRLVDHLADAVDAARGVVVPAG